MRRSARVARNAWAPPRATTDLDLAIAASIDVIDAVLRTRTRAGRELDWAYIERWAGFWGVLDRLAALRTPKDGPRD